MSKIQPYLATNRHEKTEQLLYDEQCHAMDELYVFSR